MLTQLQLRIKFTQHTAGLTNSVHMVGVPVHVFMASAKDRYERGNQAEHHKQKEIRILYLLIVAQNLREDVHAGDIDKGTPGQKQGDRYTTVVLG